MNHQLSSRIQKPGRWARGEKDEIPSRWARDEKDEIPSRWARDEKDEIPITKNSALF